jgi:hypothetical protein
MRAAMISVAVALVAGLTVAPASMASADAGDNHGGNNNGGQYSAWAYYARATGGGHVPIPETCIIPESPDLDAHVEYNVISYDGGETFTVWQDCVEDGENVDDNEGIFPPTESWDVIDSWEVTPGEPQDLVEEALTRLNPTPPGIVTEPGGGLASLVGINTYLSLEEPLTRQTTSLSEGPITVEVWADPTGVIEWDTGDGVEACNGTAPTPDGCAHVYNQSSAGQGNTDGAGRPAYHITAEIGYTGGYAVYAAGSFVGGDEDIGDVFRTSETFLAVDEAQALNTGG